MRARFLILDRDGTINEDKGYTYRIEDLVILPGVVEGLRKFRDAGWKFIVITNQAGIARGFYKESDMNRFNSLMMRELANQGIIIEVIYFSTHDPGRDCRCRNPKRYLVELASQWHRFDPKNCIFIGDGISDIKLGLTCGGTTVLVNNPQYPDIDTPHFKARNINHAFEQLKAARVV